MRVLSVVHDYLPRHRAGAEIYTHQLARALRRRGHEAVVLYAEYDRDAEPHTLRRGEYDTVPFFEATWKFGHASFEATYRDAAMERLFERVLDEVRPEVLHVQHLGRFSIGLPAIAKARGVAVAYTLHEYALTCPRRGLRMTAEGTLCDDLDSRLCAQCIVGEAVPEAPPVLPTRGERFAHFWREKVAGRSRRFVRKRLASVGLFDRARVDESAPRPVITRYSPDDWLRMAQIVAIEKRWGAVREMIRDVDLFIAPSPFLRRKFVEFGVPRRKILFSDNGIDLEPFRGFSRAREASGRVRFGYAGTIDEHKGVHVLVEAMNRLERGKATLSIHGDLNAFPGYAERVRSLAASPDTFFRGPFDNARVAEVLSSIDVLVVPSLWYENSPLTIHEAFAAKAPVVATDLGGMRDLVRDGVSGLLFRRGDPDDLARALARLASDGPLLERLRAGLPRVKTVDEDAADMEARYARLLRRRPFFRRRSRPSRP